VVRFEVVHVHIPEVEQAGSDWAFLRARHENTAGHGGIRDSGFLGTVVGAEKAP
jgi:hypothetical protein